MDWRAFPRLVKRQNLPPPQLPVLPKLSTENGQIGESQSAVPAWQIDPNLLCARVPPVGRPGLWQELTAYRACTAREQTVEDAPQISLVLPVSRLPGGCAASEAY